MGKKSNSKLGDLRLEKAFTLLVAAMVVRYTSVLRQLGKDRNEEIRFGRFINNPRVTPEQLVAHHCSLWSPSFGGKHLLVISDSTTVSFGPHASRKGLGYVGPGTGKSGFDLHPSILVDAADGGCYGLGGMSVQLTKMPQCPQEQEAREQRSRDKWKTPFEQKDRYKWFDSPRQAILNCPGAASYTLVGDREADIYELMARASMNGWGYLYRSKVDRPLSDADGGGKLHGAIGQWPVRHTYSLDLPKTKKRSAHEALLDLSFGSASIARPSNLARLGAFPEQMQVWAVQVKERPETVVQGESPVHWVLLTSHPVDSTEQAMRVVQWYCWRWIIEQVFRTLKSEGMGVEQSEVESFGGLSNLATLALLAAVQVMQLVQARNGTTSQKLGDAFFGKEQECLNALNTKVEGRTEKTKNPHPPDSMAFGAWVVARLGGWSGYESQRPPGPITMVTGLIRFYNILEGYYLIC